MAISTYSELQSAVASFLHRSDLTSTIPDFIRLAEADLQVRAKLDSWEDTATLSVVSGSVALPTGFQHALSVRWGSQSGLLMYLTPQKYDDYEAESGSGTPLYYTITKNTLLVTPSATGSAVLRYVAAFTLLSVSPTNVLLTNFPDAYLYGALYQAAVWLRDDQGMALYKPLFEEAVARVRKYAFDRRYGAAPLQMRVERGRIGSIGGGGGASDGSTYVE